MTALHGAGVRSGVAAAERPSRPRAAQTELAPLSAYKRGDVTMKASVSNQQFAAAPAATIATAVQAERPRAGEPTIRLGRLLSESARAVESMYAFLYFTRGGGGTVYYAPPSALVHADAQLCRSRSAQASVLALAKVCGGSGEDAAPSGAGVRDWYPESVPVTGDGDGFEDAGLYLDRIIGTDNDEFENATCDVRAAEAERRAGEIGGVVYTQVDLDSGDGGVSYEKGLHRVNRTGVYAVAKNVHLRKADGSMNDALAGVIGHADHMVHRARPEHAALHAAKAAKLVAEAEYEAREGGCIDAVPDMLNDARNSLVQAGAAYRLLAEHAEAAAEVTHGAWLGATAAIAGNCPIRTALEAAISSEEYVDDWYDLSEDERDQLYELGEHAQMFTDDYRKRLAEYEEKVRAHDEGCRHGNCRTPVAAASPGQHGKEGGQVGL